MVVQKVLFDEYECDEILSLYKNNHKNWFMHDRKYNSYEIFREMKNDFFFKKLKLFFEDKTTYTLINFESIYFHLFEKGDFFSVHNDKKNERVFGLGVLLNQNFIGGDFKFYLNEEFKIDKIAGNAYFFDVNHMHEITKITEGVRFSLLSFIHTYDLYKKPDKIF